MATVRDAVFEMLRARGMTTVFGNPGSTELPMLADFPDDFRYVLGLHETVAVGMADGFAQASGRPAHVNLHTAPGVGNGMREPGAVRVADRASGGVRDLRGRELGSQRGEDGSGGRPDGGLRVPVTEVAGHAVAPEEGQRIVGQFVH